MTLKEELKEKKSAIVQKWIDAALASYHKDAQGALRQTKAQFTNPAGFNLAQGLDGLFDALLEGVITDSVATFLDMTVRLRAVQDFAPSEALAFLIRIKQIVRDELGRERLDAPGVRTDLAAFDAAADDLMLYAFDLYMQCREKIYDIKAQEARSQTYRLLQKAQSIADKE
ncbi:MAG: RsbRD N-terminal domain-containing protein [Nitrospiraceae bacterium]|nr:RsbRD N-terminal domain-containing protein [Nitrospiraceae bacterium]